MNTNKKELVQATSKNVEAAFNNIKKFAAENGYQMVGDLKVPTNLLGQAKTLKFESHNQEKRFRHMLERLEYQVTMRNANRFLHFLYKHVEPLKSLDAKTPYVEYSEKELKIKDARQAWKKAQAEAEKLRLMYREEKGDFYKTPKSSKQAA